MVTSYSGLYEEYEVEHINVFDLVFLTLIATLFCANFNISFVIVQTIGNNVRGSIKPHMLLHTLAVDSK